MRVWNDEGSVNCQGQCEGYETSGSMCKVRIRNCLATQTKKTEEIDGKKKKVIEQKSKDIPFDIFQITFGAALGEALGGAATSTSMREGTFFAGDGD